MKRFLSLLICFCMIFACVGAAAEEVSQAALAEAYKTKMNELLNRLVPGNSLVLGVEPAGESPLKAIISFLQDAEENQVVDGTVLIPGQEAPVQIQLGQDTLWLSVQGQVYELRMTDVQAILQAVAGSFGAPQIDPQIAGELAQLLLFNTVLPGIQVENGENTVTIQVALTAKDVIQGFAQFVDQVLATEKYWTALQPILQYAAKQQNYTGDLAAEIQQGWPQIKEQLLAEEIDMALNANIVITTDAESGSTSVTGKADLTGEDQAITLTLDALDSKAVFDLKGALSLAFNGAAPVDAMLISANCDKVSRIFTAGLTLPAMQTEVILNGAYAAGSLQCSLAVFEKSALTATVEVEAVKAGDTITSHSAATIGGKTASCSLFWGKTAKAFSIQSDSLVLTLNIQQDQNGKVTLARLIQGPGAKGWTITYVPGLLTYRDANQTVEITRSYVSETEHVVDIAMLANGQSEASHAYIRTRLTEEGDDWRIECTAEAQGQTALTAYLASQKQEGEIPLLSSQEAIRITPEMVQMMLEQLLAASQQQAMPEAAPETGN